jgi:amino acid adenylation domain-containing protein
MAHNAVENAFALSTAQRGLWTAELLSPGTSANVTAQYSEIFGALHIANFELASLHVIEETEALRLCFGGRADRPLQWVAPLEHWSLPLIDVSGEPDPRAAALAWMRTELARPLDVASGRAFRWTLLRLGPTRFVWSFQVHHLLLDGYSRNAVWRRLDQVYSALSDGAQPPPPRCASLQDLFAEEEKYRSSANFDEDRRYFAALLEDRPRRVSLSARPAAATREFRRATVYLPRDLTTSLRARVSGASLAQAVTAAATLLLHSEVGGEDLLLGFAVGARTDEPARHTPSMLSNIVPLRLLLSPAIGIEELLSRCARAIREVMPHQRYPSQALRQDLQLSPLQPDVYGLVVNFMPFDPGDSFGVHLASTHNLSNGPVADLTIGVFDSRRQPELRIDLNGNRELYQDAELAKHLDRLVSLLAALAQGPATRRIGAILARPPASAAEAPRATASSKREQERFNDYASPASAAEAARATAPVAAATLGPRLLGPRFDAVVEQRADAVALVDGSRRFTYRELFRRAAALSAALTARGIGPGDRVGIALPRSAEMVMAVVGIVRSGAAYVPLDVLHPPDRRALILADAAPRLVVSEGSILGIPAGMEVLQLPASSGAASAPAVIPADDAAAYVIYTSGSTGRPNGVRVTQHNIARLFTVMQPLYHFTPSDVWSLFHSLAFDFSVFELWGALLTGGRLLVVTADTAKAADAFHALVLREDVTVLSQTPSAFRAFDAADAAAARPANRLRQVIFGGELLDPRTLKGWFEAHGDRQPQLANMYGITETTVHTTYRRMRAEDALGQGQSLIGAPLADLSIELLDPEGTAVADGQVGEIWVGGDGVTSGYINRPELTARRFQPDPSRVAGALRYRSGDLARRLSNGDLEYLGRDDQQVKLRGFRVELGEIEAVLRESPSVRDAVVALRADALLGPRLIAYLVGDGAATLEPDSMRLHLLRRLPEYMVPAAFVRIERVPRTVNDKVDRKSLPAPSEYDFPGAGNRDGAGNSDGDSNSDGTSNGDGAGQRDGASNRDGAANRDRDGHREGAGNRDGAGDLPRDELERTLAGVFSEALGQPGVRRDSDFFRLGGHSLLAVRTILMCRERLGVALPIRSLFEHPSVAGLAAAVREIQRLGGGQQQLAHVARGTALPLTAQQRALWLEVQLQVDDGAYNVPFAFSTAGTLDAARLRKALVHLAQTHEVLRGRMDEQSGAPCFWFDRDPSEVELDWSQALDPHADFALALRRPFDLSRGPLWRCVVRPLPGGGALFALVVHHLVIDAAGERVLLRDLAQAYAQRDPAPIKRPYDDIRPYDDMQPYDDMRPYDFADVAAHENERFSAERARLESFWSSALSGAEAPELPAPLLPCAPGAERASVRVRLALPQTLSDRVRELAAEFGTTPFHLYFAVYLALLRTYASQDDLVVGSLVSLRDTPAALDVAGYLLAPVALRMPLRGTDTFRETVAELARRWQQVSLHARLPMDLLARAASASGRAATGSPFQLFFSLLEEPVTTLELDQCDLTRLDTLPASAKFRLFLQVEQRGPAATLALEFQRGALDPEGGERLLVHFTTLLSAVTERPDARLRELSMLAPAERAMMAKWGANPRPYPKGRTVPELFEEVARSQPHAAALIAGQLRLSYRELDQRANAVAAALRRAGVARGDHVPLLLPRGPPFVICALGVLKAGAAYVPIDPQLPQERLARLLQGLRAQVGFGEATAPPQLRWLDASLTDEQETSPPPRSAATAHDVAYVMFTSGSTGQPKGVEVPHRGIVRLVRGQDFASLGPEQAWLQLAPTSFDASTLELWAPLLNGGCCIVVEEGVLTPAGLSAVIEREGATSAWLTSSLFNALIDEQPDCLAGLTQILIGGEALSPTHVRRALVRLPHAKLINGYGPTENTTFTCCHPIARADLEPGRSIPIGRPIGNTAVRVLDRDGHLAAIGLPGELVAGGDGVALGYLGLPEETSRRFVSDPSSAEPGALCYRTGDRVRWRCDGTLEFLGRFDEQLKINGHRIEPGEIAAVLAEHPAVRQAVVVAQKGAAGDSELVAYVVARDERASPDLFRRLAQHAAERLPSYMLIAAFARLSALPLKPNGKLDVAALPRVASQAPAATPDTAVDIHPGDAAVLALIGELLGQQVTHRDNLYALGADSVRLVRLVARLKSRLGFDLPIGEVTRRGDVADILRLTARHPVVEDHAGPDVPAALSPPMPACSPWQTWLWRLQLLDPSDTTAVVFRALRSAAPIDAVALEQALRALAGRHQALRCRLVGDADADPHLDLRPAEELVLRRAAPLSTALLNEARIAAQTSPFDLRAELPLRVALQPIADGAGECELWVSVHHVAYDGASEEIFWRELQIIFDNVASNRTALAGLAPLRASFLDLARRQRAALDERTLQTLERHWQEKLAGAPERMPLSWRAAETATANETCRLRRTLPQHLSTALRRLGRERRTSLAMLSLAAFEALLWRWSGERDQLIALDFAGRADEREEDQIGLFTSPVALRAELSDDSSLLDLASLSRALLADALLHRIPFERLVGALGAGRRRFAGFQIFFSHLTRGGEISLGGSPLQEVPRGISRERTDLRLMMEESPGALSVHLAGATALFDQDDLVRLADAFQYCLRQLCLSPDTKLSELEWLSPADRTRLARWNSGAADYPRDLPLSTLLEAQATGTPTAIALEVGDVRVTYGDLFQRAHMVAARLKQAGVSRGSRVGLYLDRHVTLPQSMLAILEAGGAYVPLDPAYPRDRLAFMIEDAGLCAILTRRALLPDLPPHSAQVLCVDDSADDSVEPPASGEIPGAEWLPAESGSLAYVIYTSGSTGQPKGVEVEHRQLVNFLSSMARSPGMDSSDALLAVSSVSFDIAGLEIWLPLFCGARICLAGREEVADTRLLMQALARSGATMLQATPSTWRALFASGWSGGARFKALVGGEALPADLAELLAANCGEAWNLYGPTETTVWSSAWHLPRPPGRVRVGKPIANTELHVLDERRRQLPIGVPGELFIGGEGVARGYLKRSELTAERFVGDPFRGGAARMYRTGDLARWLPDGTLELLGRDDEQLKLRGHRIEAGEVQAALNRLPVVSQSAVVVHTPVNGESRLAAYFVPRTHAAVPPSAELRAQLRQWLPEYMLPYHFVPLPELPLTPNGKVDRRRLSQRPLEHLEPAQALGAAPPEAASALEAELLAHFSRSLGRPVTLDSDFFEAGGDSLGVLRLIARLSRERAVDVTSGELFLHSTPRRMAARMQKLLSGAARPRHLLTLQKGRGRESVFLVHPMGGDLASYARLVHHLHDSVPVFGFQSNGKRAYESIEQRCAAYVEEVMAVSRGPLILGGYSLGGVLALEMAEQLRRAGRMVSLVLLLDAAVPRPLRRGWDKVHHRLTELARFSWRERRIWLRDQLSRRFPARSDTQDIDEVAALIDESESARLTAQTLCWQPPQYSGQVYLFRAHFNLGGYPNPVGALGWDRYCSDLEVLELPCNHLQILLEPQVLRIAAHIGSLLRVDSSE